jgi:hypothetical protein
MLTSVFPQEKIACSLLCLVCLSVFECGAGDATQGSTQLSHISRPKIHFFLFCFAVLLGFELRASWLLGRCSTTWATPPAVFMLITFEMWSHFIPGPAWTAIFLFMLPYVAGMIGVHHCAQPNFFLGWPRTSISSTSASQGARIMALSYDTWLNLVFWGNIFYFVLRQGLTMYLRLALNSWFSCLYFWV